MANFFVWIESLSYSVWVRESPSFWAFPLFLFLHTLGMSIVAGSAMIIEFSLLGLWPRNAPIKQVERFFPVCWVGFWINAFTGISIFMKDSSTYGRNPALYVKLVFVFAGLTLLMAIRKQVFQGLAPTQTTVSSNAKLLAAASLFCWFAAVLAGRLITYVGAVH